MKTRILAVCVLALPLFLGMGVAQSDNQLRVPEPDRNFTATVTDQEDVTTTVEKFSCEGQTYFMGRRGKTQLSVEFSKIASARFLISTTGVTADFTMKDGDVLSLAMNPDEACYGVSRYGNVRIRMKDIKTLEALGVKAVP
ncbi:MAG: hypothetical protein KKA60_05520 [Proteobacteria bacterium]|nr:hypothetical protein [Pseudomonadota bacterium]